MDLNFIAGGALVGFLVGATGVGGGSLMTPLLTLLLAVPAQVAVGTDLIFAALTKAGGAVAFARRGSVDWPVAGWLMAGSVPAAGATVGVLHVVNPDPALFAGIVQRSLGFALLLTATAIAFRAQVQVLGQRLSARGEGGLALAAAAHAGYLPVRPTQSARPMATLAIGMVIGTLVALTSVGAGALGTVALVFLFPFLPARRIVGIDIVHAVPLTLVAGLGHASLGHVDWSMLGLLLVGSLPAIHVGAAFAHRLPERALRAALATMLIAIGTHLFFS